MTVRQLKQSMDSKELSKWMAFFKVESDEKPQATPEELGEQIKAAFSKAKHKDS